MTLSGVAVFRKPPTRSVVVYYLKAVFLCILCIIPVLCLLSCSPRIFVIYEIAAISETGAAAFEQDDDLEMLKKAIPGNIKLFEALLENSPDNYRLLLLLSRLYASCSFAFFEGKLEASLLTSDRSILPIRFWFSGRRL